MMWSTSQVSLSFFYAHHIFLTVLSCLLPRHCVVINNIIICKPKAVKTNNLHQAGKNSSLEKDLLRMENEPTGLCDLDRFPCHLNFTLEQLSRTRRRPVLWPNTRIIVLKGIQSTRHVRHIHPSVLNYSFITRKGGIINYRDGLKRKGDRIGKGYKAWHT